MPADDSLSTPTARIHEVRGLSFILDSDLAALYEVPTKVLNQAVRRNPERFPEDFAFRLTAEEFERLRSQSVTSSGDGTPGGRRYLPWAFTEHGVGMVASVLRSPRAVEVSILIVREFVRLRRDLAVAKTYEGLSRRVDALEAHLTDEMREVWGVLSGMLALPEPDGRKIGF